MTPTATTGQDRVSFDLSGGAVASFSVRGTVDKAPGALGTGSLDVDIAAAGVALNQDDCTATVQEAVGGALWVSNLSCTNLRDPSSPAVACTGTGGFIIENCAR